MTNKFPVGAEVDAKPKDNDFAHEFTGHVISHNKGYIQVRDQENNVFDCDPDQLTLTEPDTKGVVASVLDAIFGSKEHKHTKACKCGHHH